MRPSKKRTVDRKKRRTAARFAPLTLILILVLAACSSDEEPAATPTMEPDEILATAQAKAQALRTFEFNGDVRTILVNSDDEDATPTVDPGLADISGDVSGEWRAPDDWVVTLEGFGFGDGVINLVSMASNGERILIRGTPDDDWIELASPVVEIPEPSTWTFVFDVGSLELKSDELIVNQEEVYTFSGSRDRTIASLGLTLPDAVTAPATTPVVEAFDIHISKEDLEVRKLATFVQTPEFTHEKTWNFEDHNEDIEFELPEALVSATLR